MSLVMTDTSRAALVVRNPIEYDIVAGFPQQGTPADGVDDRPWIDGIGRFATIRLAYAQSFAELRREVRGPEFARSVFEKFAASLRYRPTTITVRGWCRQ